MSIVFGCRHRCYVVQMNSAWVTWSKSRKTTDFFHRPELFLQLGWNEKGLVEEKCISVVQCINHE
jgi:hypothetical protein